MLQLSYDGTYTFLCNLQGLPSSILVVAEVDESGVLECRPPDEGIVPHKGSLAVYTARGDALHDIRFVLYDPDFWALGELPRSVVQAVLGDNGVGADDEDDLAHAERLLVRRPRTPLLSALLERLLDGHL